MSATTSWAIDPAHSRAEFKVRHMMISNVKGTFSGLRAVLTEHASDASLSRIQAAIDVDSLSTGDAQRDGHLKSADFFDAEQYPVMTFNSTRVEKLGHEHYAVTGELTIHGVTQSVTFDVEGPSAPGKDPYGNIRVGVYAETKINRKDFGLVWNAGLETGGVLVGEDVQISLDVQFIRA